MGDGSWGGLDDNGGSVDDGGVDGVDDRSRVDCLKDDGGSVDYGRVNGVDDGSRMDDRGAMVDDLRRLGDCGLRRECMDYRGRVNGGHDGGRVRGKENARSGRGASHDSGESYL